MNTAAREVASVPNAISATGLGMALHGASRIDTQAGLFEIAAGRILDLVDGPVARAMDQASPFGAAVDASSDKVAGAAIVLHEWRKDIAPKAALIAIIGQNVINAVATTAAMKRHPELDLSPTRDGKYAMGVQNLALGAYAQAHVSKDKHPTASRILRGLGHTGTLVGVGYFGIRATSAYIKRAR